MSSYLSNLHVDWSELYKYPREWVILIFTALPLSILFNIWIYGISLTDTLVVDTMKIGLILMNISTSWAIIFGFVGGIYSFRVDGIVKFVMTLLSAYFTYFIGYNLASDPSSPIYFFTPEVFIITNMISISFAAAFGFIFGYVLSNPIKNLLFKTKAKEIEEKGYVNLSTLDKSPFDNE